MKYCVTDAFLLKKNILSQKRFYPKVLICCLTRINKDDVFNCNLLLRNLFAEWPRELLAQIYSGGSNGDEGFCKNQYQIAACDRQWGDLFFKLKGSYTTDSITAFGDDTNVLLPPERALLGQLKSKVGSFIMNSGLYELLFKIRPSQHLFAWVEGFEPDIILAQGYNLTFSWLPVLLKKRLGKPLAYFSSDDWPSYLYASRDGLCAITRPILRSIVRRSTQQLMAAADVPFSFNDAMGEEYERRYGKKFTTLMHCDDSERFKRAKPIRLYSPEIKSIIATGAFDTSRWPLLLDLEEACQRLNDKGISVRATVLTTRMCEEGYHRIKTCRFVQLRDDPGHELLPSYLKGADLLYLPETFEPVIAQGYRYSISTKAHLFMFSHRPILVYGHPVCGLVNYAKRERWGYVVDKQGSNYLVVALSQLLNNQRLQKDIITSGFNVAIKNHEGAGVRERLRLGLNNIISK